MNKQDIINAYCRIRTIDQTIPDDVLDFIKQAAIEKLEAQKFYTFDDLDLVRRKSVEMGAKQEPLNKWFKKAFNFKLNS